MSDIALTSELTLDLQQMRDQLRRMQQDFQSFATDVNATKIQPQMQFSVGEIKKQWDAAFQTVPPVEVKLDLTVAQSQWNAWIQSLSGGGAGAQVSINVMNAQQIGADIGNSISSTLQLAASTIGAAIGQQISMNIEAGGGGGGGGGGMPGSGGGGGSGGGRGGSGSLSSMMPRGFGRLLMPLFVAHQAMRYSQIQDQFQEHMDDSGGDAVKMLEADIRRKREEDSMFMGIGRAVRFVRENTFGGESSMDEQREELRDLKFQEKHQKYLDETIDWDKKRKREFESATAPSDQAKEQLELKAKQEDRAEKDAKEATRRSLAVKESAAKRRVDAEHEAADQGLKITTSMNQAGLLYAAEELRTGKPISDPNYQEFKVTHKTNFDNPEAEAKEFREFSAKRAAQLTKVANLLDDKQTATERAEIIKKFGPTDASGAPLLDAQGHLRSGEVTAERKIETDKETAQLKAKQDLENQQIGVKAKIEEMKASGGDAKEIEMLQLKLKLEKERLEVQQHGSKEAKEAQPRMEAAEQKALENKIAVEKIAHEQHIESIQYAGASATRSLDVGSKRAGVESFIHNLDQEIKKLADTPNRTKEQNEELAARRASRDQEVDAKKEQYRRDEQFADYKSAQKEVYAYQDVAVSGQAASGDVRGAARAKLQHQMDRQLDDLSIEMERLGANDPERKRLQRQSQAHQATMPLQKRIQEIQFEKQDRERVEEMQISTEQITLHSQHRGFEAEQLAIKHKFDKQMRQAEESNAPQSVKDAIAAERDATKEASGKRKDERIADMDESTKEQQLRNQGRGEAADVAHKDWADKKELEAATGDPETQKAILRHQIANTEAAIRGSPLHAATMRGAYDQLLGAASDPGAAKRKHDLENQKMEELTRLDRIHKGQDPLTGKPLKAPPEVKDVAPLNKAANKELSDAAKLLSDAAQKLYDAPQVLTISW